MGAKETREKEKKYGSCELVTLSLSLSLSPSLSLFLLTSFSHFQSGVVGRA
jgi:hypothetical protein